VSLVGFWRWAAADPQRVAIVEVSGATVTYGELAARIHRTARGLQARGMQRGDVIATVLRNRSECFETFLAALNCGWYYVPINHHATADDIRYILENAEARALLVDDEFAAAATEAAEAANLPAAMRFGTGQAAGFVPLGELRRGQPADRPDSSVAGQVMQYTSGTTGRPKGVRRALNPAKSADAAILEMSWLLSVFGVAPGGGAHLVTAPMYHSAVHSLSHAALHYGQAVVLMEKWTAESCLELIARHRITTSHMVATHFHRLLQLPDAVRKAADVGSLTHVIHGAVPTPVDTKRRMIEWWGPVIYEYYGSSEVGGTSVGPDLRSADPRRVRRGTGGRQGRPDLDAPGGAGLRLFQGSGEDAAQHARQADPRRRLWLCRCRGLSLPVRA
jgi:long-chain acyl-CoA synthetase